ncbi:MAG: DEAD/DEAH box helicase family protein [Gemmatimonadota bacterium]|nr:DEAD/DEAH box helicase family protein [Gemmatimonadota bacterium]
MTSQPIGRSVATGLRELDLDISYGTVSDDIVRTFYSPCLRHAVLYRRAVGYFTSGALAAAAKGVAHLIANGGRIRLVASPRLTEEDIEAINRGYTRRRQVIESAIRLEFERVRNELESARLSALAWLIAHERLDVKLALRVGSNGHVTRGVFHEKTGIISDDHDNHVAFSGSSNETVGGLIDNHEVIDVFWSWNDPHGRVQRKISHFESLWSDDTPGLDVTPFTDVCADVLERFKRKNPPRRDPAEVPTSRPPGLKGAPVLPSEIQLRPYQVTARDQWFLNNGRGMLKMATGSGKTITALSIAVDLASDYALAATVIVCPFRHLVSQWARECRRHGMDPILACGSRNSWYGNLANHLLETRRLDSGRFLTVVTTNKTFLGDPFQQLLRDFPQNGTLFVADEVHNLGATKLTKCLPATIPLRLGLSATPERWFDERGTEALFRYFGPVLQPEFTLKDAIESGALCKYRYFPILVELSDDESAKYRAITASIVRLAGNSTDIDETDDRLLPLLIKRARLVACAKGKLPALRTLMDTISDRRHMLFYCGDGQLTYESGKTEQEEYRRYLEVVAGILNADFRMRVATYVAETPANHREDLRIDFESGQIDGLVAIRCLDEGVDIPAVRSAVIMASSANPRQFIQRRGRVLRNAPGKQSATIYDFIVVPPRDTADSAWERSLLRRELTRFVEFADLALNAGEARMAIWDLQRMFDLMDL